jgi:RHS repeat-associated protein
VKRDYDYDAITAIKRLPTVLHRFATYVYDAIVLPYITNTYNTATKVTVITGAHAPTPTTTTTRQCSRTRPQQFSKITEYSHYYGHSTHYQDLAITYSYTYDTHMPTRNILPASAPTTTDNTTAIWQETPANTPPETQTDVYYYGYRYYSPELGRWISRDPIGETGGLGLYLFVQNSPILYVDLYGLNIWDSVQGTLTIVGGSFMTAAGVAVAAGSTFLGPIGIPTAVMGAGLVTWGAATVYDGAAQLGAASVGQPAPDPIILQTLESTAEFYAGDELTPGGKRYIRISYYSLDAAASCVTISVSMFSVVEKYKRFASWGYGEPVQTASAQLVRVTAGLKVKAQVLGSSIEGWSTVVDLNTIYQDIKSGIFAEEDIEVPPELEPFDDLEPVPLPPEWGE